MSRRTLGSVEELREALLARIRDLSRADRAAVADGIEDLVDMAIAGEALDERPARPVTVTLQDGDVSLRWTKREADPFRWDLESLMPRDDGPGVWVEMPLQSDSFDGRDLLWSLALAVMRGVE